MRRSKQLISDPVIDTHCPEDKQLEDMLEQIADVAYFKSQMKAARAAKVAAAKARLARH
jgi:hypothetical protein